jgi:hypothetical protein
MRTIVEGLGIVDVHAKRCDSRQQPAIGRHGKLCDPPATLAVELVLHRREGRGLPGAQHRTRVLPGAVGRFARLRFGGARRARRCRRAATGSTSGVQERQCDTRVRRALFRPEAEQRQQRRFERGRHIGHIFTELWGLGAIGAVDRVRWAMAGQQFIGRDAQAVQIRAPVGALAFHLFDRRVVDRERAQRRAIGHAPGDAEIQQHIAAVGRVFDVLRLDVAIVTVTRTSSTRFEAFLTLTITWRDPPASTSKSVGSICTSIAAFCRMGAGGAPSGRYESPVIARCAGGGSAPPVAAPNGTSAGAWCGAAARASAAAPSSGGAGGWSDVEAWAGAEDRSEPPRSG